MKDSRVKVSPNRTDPGLKVVTQLLKRTELQNTVIARKIFLQGALWYQRVCKGKNRVVQVVGQFALLIHTGALARCRVEAPLLTVLTVLVG
jgi:hypothetical protein